MTFAGLWNWTPTNWACYVEDTPYRVRKRCQNNRTKAYKVLLRRFTNLEQVNRRWYLLGFLLFLIIVDENLCKTNKTYQESIFFVWHLSIPLHWSPASSSLCHLPLIRLLKIAGLSCSWGFQCFELFVNWVEYFICLPGLPLYFLQLIEHWVVLDVPVEALPAE